jgi:hypothetical protein
MSGKKKRSATGEDDSMSKLSKFVDGGIVEQLVLDSDNLGLDEPGALIPPTQSIGLLWYLNSAMLGDLQLLLRLNHQSNFIC